MHAHFDNLVVNGKEQPVLCVTPHNAEEAKAMNAFAESHSEKPCKDGKDRACCQVTVFLNDEATQSLLLAKAHQAQSSTATGGGS